MRRPLILLTIAALALSAPFLVSAAPAVSSFTVSPTSVISGQPVDFIWTLADAGGYSFIISNCPSGIKIQYASGGTFTCGAKVSSTAVVNSSFSFLIHNFSGGTRNIIAKIIPKDGSGIDVDSAGREVSVSVDTLAKPITAFTAPETLAPAGKSITVSWVSQQIDGLNLKIECKSDIKVSSPSYTNGSFLPCGTPIFSPDLSPNSSLALSFSNSSPSTLSYRLTLLPSISPGTYDATHAAYLDLDIASEILPDPVVKSFVASSTAVYSGEPVSFSWAVNNALGINLKLSCISSLSATSSKSPEEILPCDKLLFSPDLATSSSLIFSFKHKEPTSQNVKVILFPSKKAGEYDASRGKEISLTVRPPKTEIVVSPVSSPVAVLPPTSVLQPTPVPAPALSPTPSPAPLKKISSPTAPISKPIPEPIREAESLKPEQLTDYSKGGLTEQIEELLKSLEAASAEFRARSLSPEKIEEVTKSLVSGKIVDKVESYFPVTSAGEAQTPRHEFSGTKRVKLFFLIPLTLRIRVEVDKSGAIQKVNKPWWSFVAF